MSRVFKKPIRQNIYAGAAVNPAKMTKTGLKQGAALVYKLDTVNQNLYISILEFDFNLGGYNHE